jgi:DNA-binding response OmpR family regulator
VERAKGTVVVVEDDPNIAELVALYLRRDGFSVEPFDRGETALERTGAGGVTLVVADVGLPGEIDGFEVCRRLQRDGGVPVIMLTARDDEVDRIEGLELGADDYVTKPFSPRELVARVNAVLRRTGPPVNTPAVLEVGEITVDQVRREVRGPAGPVALTSREFDLLAFLTAHPGRALTRQELLDGVWGPGWFGDERTVDVHVRQLRKKLGPDLPLATVWGLGYRLG